MVILAFTLVTPTTEIIIARDVVVDRHVFMDYQTLLDQLWHARSSQSTL